MVFSHEKVILIGKEPIYVEVGSETDISAFSSHITEDEKIFVFDLDLTLYQSKEMLAYEREIRFKLGEKLKGWTKEDHFKQFDKYKSWGEVYIKGLGLDPNYLYNEMDVIDFAKYLKPDQAEIEAINKIPYKKVVFTSGAKPRAEKILEVIGLKSAFDLVFVAAPNDKFIVKPKKEAYDYVENKTGVKSPGNLFFFDDCEFNVSAAKTFGWNAYLVKENLCEQIDCALLDAKK